MSEALENRRTDMGSVDEVSQDSPAPVEATQTDNELPRRIERTDIEPQPIPVGGTEIVLQRHGKYIRDKEDENRGSLTPEAREDETKAATNYFEKLLTQFDKAEKQSVDLLVVASDTQYRGGGRRSTETGNIALEAAKQVFEKHGVPLSNIRNVSKKLDGDGESRPMSTLREPQFIDNSPDFTNYLAEKYGLMTLDFWIAFEEDTEAEKRIDMGAEGPDDIADRTKLSVDTLARYAHFYHRSNPDRRLVIWGATHYDTISPYVKREVFGVGKEVPLQVDYGAGIAIDIDTNGEAATVIDGRVYQVSTK